jgi:acetyl-CoA acetyltransferase
VKIEIIKSAVKRWLRARTAVAPSLAAVCTLLFAVFADTRSTPAKSGQESLARQLEHPDVRDDLEQSRRDAGRATQILASRRLPESVPGVSVDRQCGSSQQALHFAAALVKSGVQDIVIAAGVEHMTRVPMFFPSMLAEQAGMGSYHQAEGIRRRYPDILFRQFTGAESVARKYELNKEDLRSNCCCRFNWGIGLPQCIYGMVLR